VPQHRLTPLKEAWLKLYEPVTQNLKLDMRMNLKSKKVGTAAGLPSCMGCLPLTSNATRVLQVFMPDISYCCTTASGMCGPVGAG